MPFTNTFIVSCRAVSMLIILLAAYGLSVETFSYKSIFIGLLFSHFAYGLYYSKNNVSLIKEKKYALILATVVLLTGLYFSVYATHYAPHFLLIHVALSDAYLLTIRTRLKDPEYMALLRTVFYIACGGLVFFDIPQTATAGFLIIGLISFVAILYYTKDRTTLSLFELPLVALVAYAQLTQTSLHFHFMGFYHIVTWYGFSFWMLFVKEKDIKKTVSFFSKVFALSAAFVFLFSSVLGLSITDQSFFKIIAFWSILHIFSSIPLSKFNPRFLKNLFYVSKKATAP